MKIASPTRGLKNPVVLLGMGKVGRSLLRLILDRNAKTCTGDQINVVAISDSKNLIASSDTLAVETIVEALEVKGGGGSLEQLAGAIPSSEITSFFAPGTILVDLTASDETAFLLEKALASGGGVVLANKRPLARAWSQAKIFFLHPYVRYEATVGAGLPVISTLRNLRSCGDSFVSIKGVLSGTLGYICSQMEQGVKYSQALLRARDNGYTEPDPRDDLSGMDVLRKSLILARSVGWPLEEQQIDVEPMFPSSFRSISVDEFMNKLDVLDEGYNLRKAEADIAGRTLQYVAQIGESGGRVGLSQEGRDGPLGNLDGTENKVVFSTQFYSEIPLSISGPGAGPKVTAAGVLGDILELRVQMGKL
jgi:homoserine dehydrogenase